MKELGQQLHLFVRDARAASLTYEDVSRQARREFIEQTLVDHNFNKCRTARALGWHRNTLGRVMQDLDMHVDEIRARLGGKKSAGRAAAPAAQQPQFG